MAAFLGLHVSPAKQTIHDYQERVTTGQTHRKMQDKVIPLCPYALQVTQLECSRNMLPMVALIVKCDYQTDTEQSYPCKSLC